MLQTYKYQIKLYISTYVAKYMGESIQYNVNYLINKHYKNKKANIVNLCRLKNNVELLELRSAQPQSSKNADQTIQYISKRSISQHIKSFPTPVNIFAAITSTYKSPSF